MWLRETPHGVVVLETEAEAAERVGLTMQQFYNR
jgi:hypothetical protein